MPHYVTFGDILMHYATFCDVTDEWSFTFGKLLSFLKLLLTFNHNIWPTQWTFDQLLNLVGSADF